MFVVALVGDADPSNQRADTHPAVTLKGVLAFIGILHRGGTIVRWLVQSFEAFLGDLCAVVLNIP